ncbi:TPA: hypothetical protein L4789_001661 [Pseudomonas aeruginosa]|nr:hypothetical protein [Pseudomonas aeruginosa]
MYELKKITQKEIQYKDKYLSYTKSMIHLPIFCVSSTKSVNEMYTFKADKLEGFKKIEFNFPALSIRNDFMVFSYLLKEFYKNLESGESDPFYISFNMKDFFDYFKIIRNNRSSYAETMISSIRKMTSISLSFEREDNFYICNFINTVIAAKKGERRIQVKLGEGFLNFFKHDPNLIFNINIDNYISLEKDFSKVLYLFYTTNLHKIGKDNVASFDRDLIFSRLQSLSADKKKFELIREANEELIEKGFIKSYSFSKSGNKITKINIVYNDKQKEEIKEDKSSRPKLFK